jgi:hypothetical protein
MANKVPVYLAGACGKGQQHILLNRPRWVGGRAHRCSAMVWLQVSGQQGDEFAR